MPLTFPTDFFAYLGASIVTNNELVHRVNIALKFAIESGFEQTAKALKLVLKDIEDMTPLQFRDSVTLPKLASPRLDA